MDETKQKIIAMFKERGDDIPTSDILLRVYPESRPIKDREDINSKRQVAQLHRKLLYHINELVEDEILRFSRFGEKGLKYFTLNVMEDEEITELTPKYKKKITISRPIMPAMPIESYENQGIVIKYEPSGWIDKLNSLVINCKKATNLKELSRIFDSSLDIVNDTICLDGFDVILEKNDKKEILDFLDKLEEECKDFGMKVSCIINIERMKQPLFGEIVEKITDFNFKNVIFLYNLDSETLQENFGLINDISSIYIRKKAEMYIKNRRLQKSPYFIGLSGPYCVLDKEYNTETCLSIACAQSSLIVDVEKFYSLYGLDTEKFSQLMINVSRSFLSANSIQRRKSREYFKEVINLDKQSSKEFLEFSRNYIRFWNYGLMQPGIDPKLVLNMISEAKKKIDQFSIAEETIYKACGMPTRFKIALACAFKEADTKLSQAKYKRLEINNLDDLYRAKTKKEINEKETVTLMFDGGNDVTFHRGGDFSSEDVVREISVIINTYKMPLFSYNFRNIRGDMKITSYI